MNWSKLLKEIANTPKNIDVKTNVSKIKEKEQSQK